MSSINTLAPRLPLAIDSKFGYDMLVSVRQTTQQNLKCLLLTAPNERIMDPEFGVGLKRYLFENGSPQLNTDIKIRIRQQVKKYMPFIDLKQVSIKSGDDLSPPRSNTIFIVVKYSIRSVGVDDILNLALRNGS